ncbi:MAG: polysaccharide deacetylase family protein [Candidatus Omnitrophica bacterium]|nr:polysaccharide deacetylase family protein [Candidatus Omnitrophota bacterium]
MTLGVLQHEPVILGYHAIRETIPAAIPPDEVAPVLTARSFRRQIAFLVRHRYRVVSLETLCETLRTAAPLRRLVAITFDDGDSGIARYAAPVLREHGLPATVFVIVDAIGRSPAWLSWEELQRLRRQGITIGSHSLSHAYLPTVTREQAIEEVRESKRRLEERLQQPVRHFSYPGGGFTPELQTIVRDAGYATALTTNRGQRRRQPDLFALRRVSMGEGSEAPWVLWAKTSGYYHAFRRLPDGA